MRNSPEIIFHKVSDLVPRAGNPRTHSAKQIRQLAASIETFGWTNPVLVDEDRHILAGHGRIAAAKLLGMEQVPTLCLAHMTPAQKRAYVIADNQLALNAGWDRELLAIEFQALLELDTDFDLEITGFETAEIDILTLDTAPVDDPADKLVHADHLPGVTQAGDLWLLGDHRLLCGNALRGASYRTLMAGHKAQAVFTDPPYNVPIQGHVSGLGAVQHREFAMASGEMSPADFTDFLETVCGHLVRSSAAGSLHYICMDWRHMTELLTAGHNIFSSLHALCVWNKTNAGMGSFYRSKHELVFAFKSGTKPHINNIELGRHGRYRTNVWDYAGVNAFGENRADLALHPTVKPVQMIADAILDCTRRGDIILDPFLGSGSTLLAAERIGRICHGMELDPLYVDGAIRRWQAFTGGDAIHHETGLTFTELQEKSAARARDDAGQDSAPGNISVPHLNAQGGRL